MTDKVLCRNWGWVVLNGAVSLLLSFIVWADWPIFGLWVIGLFVGIEMVINGWSRVMLALVMRDEVNDTRLRCAF